MKCEDMLRTINDYVDGDIDPSICEDLQQHLEACPACRIVVDTMSQTIRLCKDETVYEVPLKFREKLHANLREKWDEKHEDKE